MWWRRRFGLKSGCGMWWSCRKLWVSVTHLLVQSYFNSVRTSVAVLLLNVISALSLTERDKILLLYVLLSHLEELVKNLRVPVFHLRITKYDSRGSRLRPLDLRIPGQLIFSSLAWTLEGFVTWGMKSKGWGLCLKQAWIMCMGRMDLWDWPADRSLAILWKPPRSWPDYFRLPKPQVVELVWTDILTFQELLRFRVIGSVSWLTRLILLQILLLQDLLLEMKAGVRVSPWKRGWWALMDFEAWFLFSMWSSGGCGCLLLAVLPFPLNKSYH